MSDYFQVPAQDFVPLNNLPALRAILHTFRVPLEEGCTIAGGFIRVLCRGDSIVDYLTKPALGDNHGDIDIFLPKPQVMKTITTKMAIPCQRSHAGFGWNVHRKSPLEAGPYIGASQNIQFIDYPDFCSPDPIEVVDRFDFTNVAIGLSLVDGQPTVTVHRRWRELEAEMLLDVRNSRSPFLGHRINKYLKNRGYLGVTPKSSNHITDWLAKCASDEKFYIGEKQVLHPEVIKNGVMALFERGVAPKQDIIMFLGKWEKQIRTGGDGYSSFDVEVVDWALSQMQGPNP